MKLLSVAAICLAVVVSSTQVRNEHSKSSSSESASRERPSRERVDTQWLSSRLNVDGGVSADGEYKQGREYTYVYNGQLLTGIPKSSKDHAGTRVQAIVSIVFESAQRVYMQLRDVRFGSFSEKIANPRQIHPFEFFDQVEVDEQLKEKLMLPVRFEYINGMIKDIHFDGNEQPWSANIKRSVLNMLQVNLHKERNTESRDYLKSKSEETPRDYLARTSDFYTVVEDTIEGECETAYSVQSLPLDIESGEKSKESTSLNPLVLNITKTINFEKCQRRPDIRYNHRFQDMCPTCENRYNKDERVVVSSTIIKQNLTVNEHRDRLMIESAEVESHYTYMPYNEKGNFIITYVNQTLVLVKTSSSIENQNVLRLSNPIKSDSGLIWTPDWDIRKERFFMDGDVEFHTKSPYSEVRNKVEFVKNILHKLINYMRTSVEEEAPRQFARLVKILRMLKHEELEQIHDKFFKAGEVDGFTREELHKIRKLLPDALAQAGTKDTIDHLVEKIESGEVKPWQGALAIRKLLTVRTVSEKMIEKLATLTTEEWCSTRSKAVCESSWLAIGSMLNALCVPNRDHLAIEFKLSSEKMCPRELKQKWVEKLFTQFEQCESEMCRVGLLKTIGNAGLDLGFYRLEKIARDEENKYSQLVQVEAILAFQQLVNYMPRKVQKVMISIYNNRALPAYVRMAAFHKLMETQPDKFIIDQLTTALFAEGNHQVASFAYTTMMSLANSTNPCEKRLAKDLTLSLRHSRHVPAASWMSRSKKFRTGYYSRENNMGFDFKFNSVYSNYSMLPKDLTASFGLNFGNHFTRNVLSLGISQSNFDRYIRRMVRSQSHNLQTSLSDLLEGKVQESVSPKFRKSLEQIYEHLNIDERSGSVEKSSERDTQDDAFGMLYMRVFGQEYGFLPISEQLIPEQFKRAFEKESFSIAKLIKDAERLLKDVEIPFSSQSATFLYEMQRKIPTTIGMPLVITGKMPIVAQATGVLKVNVDSLNKVRVELKDFKPSFTITAVKKIETWSPIVNTAIKVIAQAKVYAPSSVRLVVDAEKEQTEVRLTIEPTERKEYEIVKLQTRPMMTVLSWPRFLQQWQEPTEKTIYGADWTRVNEYKREFGEKSLGIVFDIKSMWHHTPYRHVSDTPYCPLSGPNKFVIRARPGLEMPKEYTIMITGKLFEQMGGQHSLSPKFEKFYEKSDEFDGSADQTLEKSSEERYTKHYKNYQESGPTQHQLKMVATTRGSSIKRELTAEVDYQIGSQGKVQKVQLKIDRAPIPQEEQDSWKLFAELETLLPKTPMTVSEISSDKKFMSRLNIKWGHVSAMDKYIDVKLVADQSKEMRQELEKLLYKKTFEQEAIRSRHESLFSPVAQYEQTVEAAYLDQYKFDVDYSVSPVVKNITDKLFRWYRYINYWQSDVNSKFGWETKKDQLKDQLRVKINIDPVNRHYFNLTVNSPKEIVRIEDIPMLMHFNGLNIRKVSTPKRTFLQWVSSLVSRNYEEAICQVRSGRINTFENVDYRTPISTCYSVVAKDCGVSKMQNKFAVLIKRQSEDSELKTLKIVSESVKLIIRPRRQAGSNIELECELNGRQPVLCSELETEFVDHGHVVLRVEKFDEEKYVRVHLTEAGIRVFFDGLSANVKVSPVYSGAVCGMCGEYNQEKTIRENCDLRTARKECVDARQPRQLQKLFESYLIRNDGECDNTKYERYTKEEEHYKYKPLQWEESNEQFYGELKESKKSAERSRERVRPVERTLTIEQAHEICFSKVPVPKCPKHTMPVEYKKGTVKVVYSCMDRNEPMAEQYLTQIRRSERVISEVRELPASFSQQERIPTKCETIDY